MPQVYLPQLSQTFRVALSYDDTDPEKVSFCIYNKGKTRRVQSDSENTQTKVKDLVTRALIIQKPRLLAPSQPIIELKDEEGKEMHIIMTFSLGPWGNEAQKHIERNNEIPNQSKIEGIGHLAYKIILKKYNDETSQQQSNSDCLCAIL